jgi:hypothetical protein
MLLLVASTPCSCGLAWCDPSYQRSSKLFSNRSDITDCFRLSRRGADVSSRLSDHIALVCLCGSAGKRHYKTLCLRHRSNLDFPLRNSSGQPDGTGTWKPNTRFMSCAQHAPLNACRHRHQPGPERRWNSTRNTKAPFGKTQAHEEPISFLPGARYLCSFPSGIPTQVVNPSVSRAAVLHGTAFTVFAVSSGPTTSRPGPPSICGKSPLEYGVGVGLESGGLTNLSPVFPVGLS